MKKLIALFLLFTCLQVFGSGWQGSGWYAWLGWDYGNTIDSYQKYDSFESAISVLTEDGQDVVFLTDDYSYFNWPASGTYIDVYCISSTTWWWGWQCGENSVWSDVPCASAYDALNAAIESYVSFGNALPDGFSGLATQSLKGKKGHRK